MFSTITLQKVSKYYGNNDALIWALQDITTVFHQKDFTSIIGASGSGKSTLLNMIGTLERPSSGNVLLGDRDVTMLHSNDLADIRSRNIGFIFQQFHLLPSLTALENVCIPLFHQHVPFHKEKRAKELLQLVGLKEKISSFPSQLSGGQQQRVAIARALITRPDWLLADEPTGNLDSETGKNIFELLISVKEINHCGIILVTHDPSLAEKTDRIIEMKDGAIIRDEMIRSQEKVKQ
ncbi:ABC transporter ATP-binding protein [Bacillus chungangensis]|uniref:ABC transport system ATP-binding protein/lipoprotein-releasing system ATP-binding protein n=1 Tax=Bacillus chungangensis TaxID=587633 RepID=A0ABT9WR14_9BACI|nr:ABC transporter ATP-binding protein [Bacillus chungangensis]MDQ0175647.1 putative ABC transport system ATP-binding protein/lipoprotein-releasing system ATP-binding protein [Bacillus chungangensis]